jgi:hypothetical protein
VRERLAGMMWNAGVEHTDELRSGPPEPPGLYFDVQFRPSLFGEESGFVVCKATFLVRMAETLDQLNLRIIVAQGSIRHRLRVALALAKDRCRSAIDRCRALILLKVLLDLVVILAVEALSLVRAEPPPGVLAAGGKDSSHVPLN